MKKDNNRYTCPEQAVVRFLKRNPGYQQYDSGRFSYCLKDGVAERGLLREGRRHILKITFPDGRVYCKLGQAA